MNMVNLYEAWYYGFYRSQLQMRIMNEMRIREQIFEIHAQVGFAELKETIEPISMVLLSVPQS